LIALAFAFATRGKFVFVAPGAVEIYMPIYIPSIELEIALAGPLTNVLIASLCIPLHMLKELHIYAYVVGSTNSFLAFFNLLPIPPLDGYKVFRISLKHWFLSMALATVSWVTYLYLIH